MRLGRCARTELQLLRLRTFSMNINSLHKFVLIGFKGEHKDQEVLVGFLGFGLRMYKIVCILELRTD